MSESENPIAATENIMLPAQRISSVGLPKTRLSLWAVLLVLIGALGLLSSYLIDPIYFKSVEYFYFSFPSNLTNFYEALSLTAAAILLFTTRASGRSLRVPIFIWCTSTLSKLLFGVFEFIDFRSDFLYAFYRLLIGALPLLAAAIFSILYTFRVIKKTPALIIIGALLALVTAVGIDYISNWFDPSIQLIKRYYTHLALIFLYYLLFPTGMFLTVLASKKKDV